MNIILPGDKDYESRPSIQRKSLRINLNENIYGTFVEIGAGQEVARHFYRVGAASGTIAKSMSAYDKSFSDSIYGKEQDGRYVTQNRLDKMLNHEMNLLEKRISRKEYPNKFFFVYANTVATIDFVKKFKGHGWMGIKFQTDPKDDYSEIKLHVRFHQNEAKLQQESLGIMGVNLIYGAFYKHNEPLKLMRYLNDHIDDKSIEIDTINFNGPLFKDIDNRLISLELVRLKMTDAVIFDNTGTNVLPAQVLYKKNILTLRGSYRPITKVNEEMFKKSLDAFLKEKGVKKENTIVLLEITLSNLISTGNIDDSDYLDRAKLLCSQGHMVMISNFSEYYKLVKYLTRYTKKQLGLTMGVTNLVEIFDEKYYDDVEGGILEAFGNIFKNNMKIYLYPVLDKQKDIIIDSNNLKLEDNMKEFYKYFKVNDKIRDLEFNKDYLSIFSKDVLKQIKNNTPGWEDKLPKGVSDLIIKKKLFGYK
ncbi:MAG: TonB-dependent receptor [Bacteroidetes bacterium]|nr:TonB-dependent receptor [Bacteroidota bacterium]MDA0885487.1 TonB-dependent receptor [Bacteroidota bacterium]MDA1225945.1 TonB-dependent receptor [Bacteroidota bacterium]